jgi:DNA polymerase-3 subunit gamma/tau
VPEVIPAPTQLEPAPKAATSSDGELSQLILSWREIIEQAPEETKKTPALAILRSAGVKPIAIESNTIVLAFRYPLHKENLEKIENRRVAEKIISHFLGRTCHIRCIHEPVSDHLLRAALKEGAQIISVEER